MISMCIVEMKYPKGAGHKKPHRLRYKMMKGKTRKMRKRMRGGNPLEGPLFQMFRRGAQRVVTVVVETAGPAVKAAVERAATGARAAGEVIVTGARTVAERAATRTGELAGRAAMGARGLATRTGELAGRAAMGARGLAGRAAMGARQLGERAATGASEIAGSLARGARNLAGRAGRFAGRFGRRAPVVVRQAEGRATTAAANAAAPAARTVGQAITELAGSLSQRASTWVAATLPVLYAEAGANAVVVGAAVGRTAGRSIQANPQAWRTIIGAVWQGAGALLRRAAGAVRVANPSAAAPVAAELGAAAGELGAAATRPAATILRGLITAGERGAVAEAEVAAGRAAQRLGAAAERAAAREAEILAGRAAQRLGAAAERAAVREAEVAAGRAAQRLGAAAERAAVEEAGVLAGRAGRTLRSSAAQAAEEAIGRVAGEAGVAAERVGQRLEVAAGRAAQQAVRGETGAVARSAAQGAVRGETGAVARSAAEEAVRGETGAIARSAAEEAVGRVGVAGERAVAEVAAEAAGRVGQELGAAARVVPSGPITPAMAGEFGQPQMLEYLTKNNVRLPRGMNIDVFKSAVRRPDKVLAQKKAFFEALVADGRMQGTPAEILEAASKVIGDTEAAKLFASEAPVAAAQKAINAAERAAIEAIPQGPRRADAVADLIAKNLEKAAAEEAEAIGKATEGKLVPANFGAARTRMMDRVIGRYNQIFGLKPSQLMEELRPTGTNISRAYQTGVTNAGITEYAAWLRRSRQFFEGQVGPDKVRAFRRVLGPERMVEFRQGMLRLFSHDPAVAEGVFEDFAIRVVPRLGEVSEELARSALGEFFSALRTNIPGAREALNTLITRLGAQALSIATGTQRSMSTLPIRILGQVARGAVGSIVGLFVFVFQGTPSGTGLGEVLRQSGVVVRDGVFRWFGIMLWRDPPAPGGDFGRVLATVGGFGGDFGAMMLWLGGQARTWLWGIFTAILVGIGISAQGVASRVVGFFRGTAQGVRPARVSEANPLTPPELRGPLTPTEVAEIRADNAATATATTQGGYRRRTHRKYR